MFFEDFEGCEFCIATKKGPAASDKLSAMDTKDNTQASSQPSHFLRHIIEQDISSGRISDAIRTRFPPEPNGYLHVGHAKSICLNFGLARDYRGRCHLRFDDTNPEKESQEYVDSIVDVVRWLGFEWKDSQEDNLYYASDYFETMVQCAEYLICTGHAYVDEQTAEQMRANRGTLTELGKDSPWRDRPIAENLAIFADMRAGKYPEGSRVVRAKIDMTSPNINLRDPAIYRIRFAHHHRTGDAWCIYPMYTFAHPIEDAVENITHSICTLEFEDQRPFYDWLLERLVPKLRPQVFRVARQKLLSICSGTQDVRLAFARRCREVIRQNPLKLGITPPEAELRSIMTSWYDGQGNDLLASGDLSRFYDILTESTEVFAPLLCHALDHELPNVFQLPHQYEFARLNLTYVVTSKRKLADLVNAGHVDGWDDPRMPTLVGLRRRGYTPESLRLFADRIGVSKADSWIDYSVLEQALRDDLDPKVVRRMAVLDPLKLVITNVDESWHDSCRAPVHPQDPERGQRQFPMSRELWIERDDFVEIPPKGYFRLFPGNLVRLKYGYVVRCLGCTKGADGQVLEVQAELLHDTKSGTPGADSVKVKGNITWVSVAHGQVAEICLYDRLFMDARAETVNPASKKVVSGYIEPGTSTEPGELVQFERLGYFVADRKLSSHHAPVFNRAVTLKDSWGK